MVVIKYSTVSRGKSRVERDGGEEKYGVCPRCSINHIKDHVAATNLKVT